MEPYYERDGITIYHGSCGEVMPRLGKVDLVLTDPPYGLRAWNTSGGQSLDDDGAREASLWDVLPSPELMQLVIDAGEKAIIWGGNYLCGILGMFKAPLVWNKCRRGMHFADGEIAWTNLDGTTRIFDMEIVGNWRAAGQSPSSKRERRMHPTQKPTELMQWCIQRAKLDYSSALVLDPFMGSGSSLIAARNLGLAAIGVELEEKYCEIAAERLSQRVLIV